MIRATIDISVVLFTSNFRIADVVVEIISSFLLFSPIIIIISLFSLSLVAAASDLDLVFVHRSWLLVLHGHIAHILVSPHFGAVQTQKRLVPKSCCSSAPSLLAGADPETHRVEFRANG
jgi:hypothetical protein